MGVYIMSLHSSLISQEKLQYLELLSQKYPTIQEVCTEIINLQAILNLPKGTEHFISDIHGEDEAFYHMLNNCSGVIREKVKMLFDNKMSQNEQAELCTLIYYTQEKIDELREKGVINDEWYSTTLLRLIEICKLLSTKYTRSKVRKALPKSFSYIIDELLHANNDENINQIVYHRQIINTIINIDNAESFIIAMSELIKRLAVDRLHIVGDIFDRGSGADKVMDMLMNHHSVDIEWGNHDILWMGAAAGSRACIATVLKNSIMYRNYATLENGYGISLRSLFLFAEKNYKDCKDVYEATDHCIAVLLFKLEGEIIKRHPEYDMQDRLFLDKIDYKNNTININGTVYALNNAYFPTIDINNPYELTDEENTILTEIQEAFSNSEKLHKHINFLYANGSMYKQFNQNLLFHGCIPLDENGEFTKINIDNKILYGKNLLDWFNVAARRAYFLPENDKNKEFYRDTMWYLWCGKNSPLFGRNKMTTFERMYIKVPELIEEKKDPYYKFCNDKNFCQKILKEFDIHYPNAHIINGHVPVKVKEGESPVKADNKLIIIDGGMCKHYQATTGIAGYTLIYNSHGMRLMSHEPFTTRKDAILNNTDINSTSNMFETEVERVYVKDTDIGENISNKIYDLTLLMHAYKDGTLIPSVEHQI